MVAFATAQELRTFLDGTVLVGGDELDDEWTAQADLFLELVSGDIQSAARSPIVKPVASEIAQLPGTFDRDLVLPRRPVVSVDAVSVNGVALAAGSFTFNNRTVIRRGALPGLDDTWTDDSKTAHWGGPSSTVEVTYSHGYDAGDVPVIVKALTLHVAAREISNPAGMIQETFGGWSETFARVLDSGGVFLSEEQARMLRRKFSRTGGTIGAR